MKLKDSYSLEEKLWLPRQHIQKQRHYFANKGLSCQGYGFPCSHVWIWELDYKESWAPKNWCFWTVVLEKTLASPWTARRSNQSILKEISPEYSLAELMWKRNSSTLATWNKELTHLKRPWCGERLKAGGEGADKGWDGWMASLTQWSWVWVNSRSWCWTGRPGVLQSMGVAKSRTRLSNWTERNCPWKRKCQPSPVFLPKKSHEQRSLAGYCPWGHKESATA